MKRLVSLLLACMLLAGCTAPGIRTGGAAPAGYALSEPVYPEFPQQPQYSEETGDWEAYSEAYQKYMDALLALRGEEPSLTQGERTALNAFAARSTSLVLAEREGENAVYSPLSLWSALAVLAQCAEGDSRRQVLDALGADSTEELQNAVSRIWRTLYTDDGLSSLILGNSIWLSDTMKGTYVQKTLDTLAENYFAGVYSVPMGTAEADQAVSGWVKEQTNGLIGVEDPVVQTDGDTLALLASTLYYRAGWESAFALEWTEEDIFTDAAGAERQIDFMHKTQDTAFLRREGYQAASLLTQLDYLGEMVFVLPDEGVTPESLLQDPAFLSALNFSGEDISWGEVQWSVPKFDINSELDLKGALTALGITDLLDPAEADLSALTELDAFLYDAKQLARIKVDEEGVEAAAVTLMGVNPTSAMPDPDPEICVMDLDRPFLFVIRTQDVPLFVGVVNQV